MHQDNVVLIFIGLTGGFILLCIVVTTLVIRHSNKLSLLHFEKHRLENEGRKMVINEGERTMNQLSKEIHDNISYGLTLLKITLQKGKHMNSSTELSALLGSALEQVVNVSRVTTNISHSANYNFIKSKELLSLLESDLEYMRTYGHIDFDIRPEGVPKVLTPEAKLLVYRIAQQAFNNILKHSGANYINLDIQYGEASFRMGIEDNGIGIAAERIQVSNGIGLTNMRERAELLGGHLDIKISQSGRGCNVVLFVPNIRYSPNISI